MEYETDERPLHQQRAPHRTVAPPAQRDRVVPPRFVTTQDQAVPIPEEELCH